MPAHTGPTWTHAQGVQAARRWLLGRGGCKAVFTEINTPVSRETPDAIGFLSVDHTVLIEVKISRSDLLADRRKPWRTHPERGVGDWRYLLTPPDVAAPGDLPPGWGLLHLTPRGVRPVHLLAIHETPETGFLATALWYEAHPEQEQPAIRARWARCRAEQQPKHADAERQLLFAAVTRLESRGGMGIVHTPEKTRVTWSIVNADASPATPPDTCPEST